MKMRRWMAAAILTGAALLLCGAAAAQQPAPVKTQSAAPAGKKKRKGVLGLIPTYSVSNGQNSAPLTSWQKLHLAFEDSANPFEVAEAAIKAEYYRGTNPRKKIGHGGAGYMKQWGASYLDEISGNAFREFLYPSLLHQDPRYYRRGKGSIASRVAYAFSRVVVTRGDGGGREFNASGVLGSATSTTISQLYYPAAGRGVGRTFVNIGLSLVGSGASNTFKEFWPDVARRLSKKR